MELTINISDYIGEDDIKEIIKDSVKGTVRELIVGQYNRESGIERLLTNISYTYVVEMVNECFGGELKQILIANITRVISELTAFTVFRKADAWEREDSAAMKILNEVSNESRPLIEKRVTDIIAEYPFNELKQDEIGEVVYQCIMDKLFSKEQTNG